MALVLVQSGAAVGPGSNPGPIVTLSAFPTSGNFLIAQYGGQNNGNPAQTSGNTLTRVGTVQQAHASFGSYVNTYYRKVQAGDGKSYGFDNIGASGLRVAEFSGPAAGATPLNVTQSGGNVGQTLAIAPAGATTAFSFASYITRLEFQDINNHGSFSVNGSSTEDTTGSNGITGIVFPNGTIGGMVLLFGAGNATLGGTQTGVTRDGYNWGVTAFTLAGLILSSLTASLSPAGTLTPAIRTYGLRAIFTHTDP